MVLKKNTIQMPSPNNRFPYQNLIIWSGALLVILTTLSPLVAVTDEGRVLKSLNLYQIDIRIFLISYSFLALTLFSYFNRQQNKFRFLTIAFLMWNLLLFLLIYLKTRGKWESNVAENLITGQEVQFLWTWIPLSVGVSLMLISSYFKAEISTKAR